MKITRERERERERGRAGDVLREAETLAPLRESELSIMVRDKTWVSR